MSPLVVDHPIFESGMLSYNGSLFNMVESKKAQIIARELKEEDFKKCKTAVEVLVNILKAYRLVFFKYICNYLSLEDFSVCLGYVWTISENPNAVVNVKLDEIKTYFKCADKSILMHSDEYEKFQSLPSKIRIYSGIKKRLNAKGLSWTLNKEKAIWFKNRYGTDGIVLVGIAKKKDILAYFNRRDEDEVIVNKVYKVHKEFI